MIVKTLVENTSSSPNYQHKHGLSLYIETAKHKLLFDLGPNGLFLENAKKLGVSIPEIDTVIISHGHRDHGGALGYFLKENQTAKVYVRENAFQPYSTKLLGLNFSVSLDASLRSHPQVVLTHGDTIIDDELRLFSGVSSHDCPSASNKALFMKQGGKWVEDDFSHEQNLIISEDGKHVLLCGCSHSGIVNIKARATEILGQEPDVCIGGFHLYNPVSKKKESPELVKAIASRLLAGTTVYYTCHCTGKAAYQTLKTTLQDRLNVLSTGAVVNLIP